ncbi:fibrobacter succinogenes major paralogous domain-containing protein [Prevotella communis]|uniref:fibrobacter succinogenes major paralogous domain-containing protein n=1 Tax=Prevotella communis TaxID=2913614 RepID=UPI001EDC5A9A|nr:fibrobacter succinogenes major paralogous domain-containing protein [Prevotella communis]UKK61072.1 fibrobacter succinogenes major paralogous domain-containing protein [Prevotella communis]UKK63897.1 fibrobacter succinogenes major paralogous domain-containing protein [Prevotella communis]
MKDSTNIKMQLLDKYGDASCMESVDFCRAAYRFITEEDDAATPSTEQHDIVSAPAHVQAIDLGLPSGTLWADRNVGAKSPEDYGAFFSWGNTEPLYPVNSGNDWGDDDDVFAEECAFTEDNYKKTEGYKLKGDIDISHDAARINMGEPWLMPTSEQFQELYDNCTWIRKTINGMNGYLVTSKINGNSIFFACAGYCYGASLYLRGSYGYYWSSTYYSATNARYLSFSSSSVSPQSYSSRRYGFSVRAVQKLPKK